MELHRNYRNPLQGGRHQAWVQEEKTAAHKRQEAQGIPWGLQGGTPAVGIPLTGKCLSLGCDESRSWDSTEISPLKSAALGNHRFLKSYKSIPRGFECRVVLVAP